MWKLVLNLKLLNNFILKSFLKILKYLVYFKLYDSADIKISWSSKIHLSYHLVVYKSLIN